VTAHVLRLLEALYSLPGLASLLRLVGRAVAVLVPSGVSVADAAIAVARLSWYALDLAIAGAVAAAIGYASYGFARLAAYLVDRVSASRATRP
jgi:hypothetical protein